MHQKSISLGELTALPLVPLALLIRDEDGGRREGEEIGKGMEKTDWGGGRVVEFYPTLTTDHHFQKPGSVTDNDSVVWTNTFWLLARTTWC